MRTTLKLLLVLSGATIAGAAYAYKIDCKNSDSCDVFCDGGAFVGTMYWNGTQWSDGLRWSKDKDELAKLMVAAQGGACR